MVCNTLLGILQTAQEGFISSTNFN